MLNTFEQNVNQREPKRMLEIVYTSINLFTNRARGPYRGILARGRGSTDRAQRGPYKTTSGQYSPVRLELARLVSSLLYGTLG